MKTTFEDWMAAVDSATYQLVGMSIYDLPDVAFMDMFEDGVSAKGAARAAIKEAKSG